MGHGYPDYGIASPLATVFILQDLAELAARLGSILTFDRRGNVTFLEDFEGSLERWITHFEGTGGKVESTAAAARSGAFAAALTTGNLIGKYAYISHWMPMPILSRMGAEFSFCWWWYASIVQLDFNYATPDGGYRAQVRYNWQEQKIEYCPGDFDWQTLATGIKLERGNQLFHTIKVVADFPRKKYTRLILDSTSLDLSYLDLATYPPVSYPRLVLEIRTVAAENQNVLTYIDDAIITQNEP